MLLLAISNIRLCIQAKIQNELPEGKICQGTETTTHTNLVQSNYPGSASTSFTPQLLQIKTR